MPANIDIYIYIFVYQQPTHEYIGMPAAPERSRNGVAALATKHDISQCTLHMEKYKCFC